MAVRAPMAGSSKDAPRPELGRHFLAGLLQSGGLYFTFGFRALHWVTPYLVYFILLAHEYSVLECAAWAAGSAMMVIPALIFATVAIKWLVLGRIQPGRRPLWGGFYLRWWFVGSLVLALPLKYFRGTPLFPFSSINCSPSVLTSLGRCTPRSIWPRGTACSARKSDAAWNSRRPVPPRRISSRSPTAERSPMKCRSARRALKEVG